MGCDIHFYVEKYVYDIDRPGNGTWISIDKWTLNPYYSEYPDEPEWEVTLENEMFSERNYFLFAILANVRNQDHLMIPISTTRGLPDDVSPKIKILSDYEGIDAHSHSWLTVKEIIDYDWDRESIYNGKKFTPRDCCKEFINEFIPKILKLAAAQDLRLVFWFDN
jgi:hypothetical protein